MVLLVADDDNGGQFTTHHVVDTGMREKDLLVVYMNEPVSVESSVQTTDQLLAEDKNHVVGIKLKFTGGHAEQDQKAIIDPNYMKTKDKSKKDKKAWQSASDERLDEEHVK
ncbi:putative methyltransferase PMT27 [Hordeum vulgare]|nr:putative methyltransferase PMT27 [Hordeum vulgare]